MKPIKIKEVIDFLLDLYPLQNQLVWDASGIINKVFLKNQLHNVLVVADLDEPAMTLALENNVNLIISHHPLSLNIRNENDPYIKKIIKIMKLNKIVFLSLHTNFDVAKNGLVKAFCNSIGFKEWTMNKFIPGLCEVKFNQNLSELIKLFKNQHYVDYVKVDRKLLLQNPVIKRCLIGLGAFYSAAYDYLQIIKKSDLFVTGDLKWSNWIHALNNSIKVIDIGHKIEAVFIKYIKDLLLKHFHPFLNDQIFDMPPSVTLQIIN